MQSLGSKINAARPRLYKVAPLTAYICWWYAAVNMLIGLALFALYEPAVPIAVASIFSYQVWGLLFFSAGASGAYGLIRNHWELVRNAQLWGLLIKAIWLIALIVRSFVSPQTILITLVWILFSAIQAGVYIYFIPAVSSSKPEVGNV